MSGKSIKTPEWTFRPDEAIPRGPYFEWPVRPLAIMAAVARTWSPLSYLSILLGLAALVWTYMSPPLASYALFEPAWIAFLYLRNLTLTFLFCGGLHLYLVTYECQGAKWRFHPMRFGGQGRQFFLGDQLWDNIFWNAGWGVMIWTAYESLILWAYATGRAPYVNPAAQPIWFTLLFVAIPLTHSTHFYLVHRFVHWRPMYRWFHAVHHRNVAIGPWSGFSMHPVEQAIYLSLVLAYLVVPSHPVHLTFHLFFLTIGGAFGHAGFAKLQLGRWASISMTSFHHQIHHRYFSCNYGAPDVPLDEWAGSFHDGTPEATKRLWSVRRSAPITRD